MSGPTRHNNVNTVSVDMEEASNNNNINPTTSRQSSSGKCTCLCDTCVDCFFWWQRLSQIARNAAIIMFFILLLLAFFVVNIKLPKSTRCELFSPVVPFAVAILLLLICLWLIKRCTGEETIKRALLGTSSFGRRRVARRTRLRFADQNRPNGLLIGFSKGRMESELQYASTEEVVDMFPVICSCITLLPFGMHHTRTKLLKLLEHRIRHEPYARQELYFLLASFINYLDVERLFRNNPINKKVRQICSKFYNLDELDLEKENEKDKNKTKLRSLKIHVRHVRHDQDDSKEEGVISPFALQPSDRLENDETEYKLGETIDLTERNSTSSSKKKKKKKSKEEPIVFDQFDPITFFRLPIDSKAKKGFQVFVGKKFRSKYCDPITGTPNVHHVTVRSIFKSNARPFLIDCYCVDSRADKVNQIFKSSSYILKAGDDLRKDYAVIQMFRYTNHVWRSKNLKFRKQNVEALAYKVVPFGFDIGVIELIQNCTELSKITTLVPMLQEKNSRSREKFNRLIATAAGSYIAAFIMGIRDRHTDNILINKETCQMFHIDFGYMFGDRTAVIDTSKLAITADLKKVIQCRDQEQDQKVEEQHQDSGWNDFIKIATEAYLMIRKNSDEFIDYARVVFQFLFEVDEIETFLRGSLKLDISDENAKEYVEEKLRTAPKKWKTKMKNLVHGISQNMSLL